MENQMLQLILDKLISVESDVRDLKQGQAKLEQGQAKLEQGQAKLEQGQAKLEQGQAKLEQGQAKLEQGQAETNARLGNLETRFDDLTHLVHGIHIHQEMDFKLLTDVSEKVDSLADVRMLQ